MLLKELSRHFIQNITDQHPVELQPNTWALFEYILRLFKWRRFVYYPFQQISIELISKWGLFQNVVWCYTTRSQTNPCYTMHNTNDYNYFKSIDV